MLNRKNKLRRNGILSVLIPAAFLFVWVGLAAAQEPAYVGSEACRECHEEQYETFKEHSKKVHSFEGVRLMKKGLTREEYIECLECHTTGYGKPGGFVSEEETPHMMEAGCEVCHGPGGAHIESGDSEDIRGQVTIEHCEHCHNQERVEVFKFKPLIFGGAH